jgi:hypothetical protein
MSWPWRSLAALLLMVLPASNGSWAIACGRTESCGLFAFRGRTICLLTVSPVCGRRSEVAEARHGASEFCGGMQGWSDWSGAGAKLASQSSCAGGAVPTLGARHECKCRLGEAGGIVLPRHGEERSDEFLSFTPPQSGVVCGLIVFGVVRTRVRPDTVLRCESVI